jgi:hypothetical protein
MNTANQVQQNQAPEENNQDQNLIIERNQDQNVQQPPERNPEGTLVRQLDVLLLKAAKASTKSLDGNTINTRLRKLVDDGALDRNSLRLLKRQADEVKSAMKALNGLTGRQMATAFKTVMVQRPAGPGEPPPAPEACVVLDERSQAGRVISRAVKAQDELSSLLAQLDKRLDALERHDEEMRAANRDYKGVDEDIHNEIVEMRQLCDRRSTEIQKLAYQMRGFALKLAAQGLEPDPNIRAILRAKVDDLLPRQALAMHGTVDSLAAVSEATKLKSLAAKIDSYKTNPALTLTDEAIAEIRNDIHEFKLALEVIKKEGVQFEAPRGNIRDDASKGQKPEEEIFTGGMLEKDISDDSGDNIIDTRTSVPGKGGVLIDDGLGGLKPDMKVVHKGVMVPRDIIEVLERDIADIERKFTGVRTHVARDVYANFYSNVKALLKEDPAFEQKSSWGDDSLQAIFNRRNQFLNGLNALLEAALNPNTTEQQITALKNALAQQALQLKALAKAYVKSPAPSAQMLNTLIDRFSAIEPIVVSACALPDKVRNSDQFFTGSEAMSLFKGELSVSSIVEARARGHQDADVNPLNDDVNIISERKLGAGATSNVYELVRKDGRKLVFKGEVETRSGLGTTAGAMGKAYVFGQQTCNLNFASRQAADALGLGGLIVSYSVGTHNGTFGFYMGKARGVTARAFTQSKSTKPEGGLSAKEISRLPDQQKARVKADIMRELNRLQWIDLLTGQADRHWDNYFIHVDSQTLKVTVRGIDNDLSFSKYRTGAVQLKLDTDLTATFKSQLRELARTIDSRHADDEYQRLLNDPGITIRQSGKITIDGSRIQNKAIGHLVSQLVGVQSFAVPDKIDRETYDALVALKQGEAREQYLNSIRSRLAPENYEAAVARLDDVIAHAERLREEGRIIQNEPNGWLQAEETARGTGRIQVQRGRGDVKNLGGQTAKTVHEVFCPSYFARDGIDKIFA